MNFYKQIPFYKIALLNLLLGAIMAYPLLWGLILINGFLAPPTTQGILAGSGMILGCFLVFLVANLLLWKFGKGIVKLHSTGWAVVKSLVSIAILLGAVFGGFGIIGLLI